MEKKKFGTMYIDDFPISPGFKYQKPNKISIGDTVSSCEIEWVELSSGLLVADRCVCSNVSWEQLNEFGLIFGTAIQIDSKWYLCRCLKVGNARGTPNEWDSALDEAGNSDELWNWSEKFFWGQETIPAYPVDRAYRGCNLPRHRGGDSASTQNAYIGFRPALEPLDPVPLNYGPLVGAETTFVGPDSEFVSGRLTSFTDYDLVLEAASPLPDACKWGFTDGKCVILDRSSVYWLRKHRP